MSTTPATADQRLVLNVRLTEGAIRNGYIQLASDQTMFPSRYIAPADKLPEASFELALPNDESISTYILSKFNRIRARLGSLFKQQQLSGGDVACFTFESEGHYRLKFVRRTISSSNPKPECPEPMEIPAVPAQPLNQILFGPPGTGKTFATVDAALAILSPESSALPRDGLKARFDQLMEDGAIRFVTFHQSFSYEDFVEGLRAVTGEDGSLRYEVVDGVFKDLCLSAHSRLERSNEAPTDFKGRRIWKMSLGNTLGADANIYDQCLEENCILLGYGGDIDFSGCKTRKEVSDRFVQAGQTVTTNDYGVTSVTAFVSKMKIGDLVVVSDGNFRFRAIGEVTGGYTFQQQESDYCQRRAVKWLRTYTPSRELADLMKVQFSQMTIYELGAGALDMSKLERLLMPQVTEAEVPAAKVLIIDEINRGNISRIFGELITLIEPSKRNGAAEALSATLPYSKHHFSVPDNVYLIGTMNTADRSLAGMDIAIRRRFNFVEMPPRPDLLDGIEVHGINIGQLLRVMNQRIEVLLDRDHCLGHAYFMPLCEDKTLSRLESIFRNQVLPLLQEYFFEDWQRVQWVLNDHRKSDRDRFVRQQTHLVQSLFGGDANVPSQNLPWYINEDAFGRAEAYQKIIDHRLAEPVEADEAGIERESSLV
ncbi:AAA family ATPase [Pseudomonas psychrophila]|uniref:AAA family ATPase n=1 Tax=Pseudomonas psychrophila TaxID=122355 RepID=UPI0003572222|nr:AAA family ATPase [Pseudomonas psychrophila]EPJ95157.1 McrB-related protein [Pseudomonas psychrophila]